MEIYIEYAFLENFLFDGVLLTLALLAAKSKISWWRILLSALCGAVFALVFPLLRLSEIAGTALKIAVGFLLCMLVAGRLKTKKEWGRYVLISVLFFCLSFGFGGSLLGVYGQMSFSSDREFAVNRMPSVAVFVGFAVLSAIVIFLVRKLYARRAVCSQTYDCRIRNGEKYVKASGFLDSGNLAAKNGLPVCFVSPDLIYELWGEELIHSKEDGQVRDEMRINTLAGEKNLPLYGGEIEVKTDGERRKKRVYFAPSQNMISREYKILLNPRIFEGCTGEEP